MTQYCLASGNRVPADHTATLSVFHTQPSPHGIIAHAGLLARFRLSGLRHFRKVLSVGFGLHVTNRTWGVLIHCKINELYKHDKTP